MSTDQAGITPSLAALLARPRLRAFLRGAAWAMLGLWLALAALVLSVRHWVLPGIDGYRGDIAAMIGRQLGMQVDLAAVSAQWSGLRPELALRGLVLHDAAGRPALSLDRVEAELGWSSLLTLRPQFRRLEIVAPQLSMRREENGHIYVAGLQINTEGQGGDFADWLLSQHEIRIRDARLEWTDALRKAPPLVLERLNFRLDNSFSHHRFGFTAHPPAALAAALDVRGDLHGRDPDDLPSWRGELYAALDYANLGAWRTWVDYPLEVDGMGGLHAWLEFAGGKPTALTADVALRNARVRLRKDLEPIELAGAEGRVQLRQAEDGFSVVTRQLALVTRDGQRVAPTDFSLRVDAAHGRTPAHGDEFA
ncbi:MAG: TIGR02099 family protein, partial [Zoogloea sp.]|nr:TIGR02099 family protein [Zoogloea sp.]